MLRNRLYELTLLFVMLIAAILIGVHKEHEESHIEVEGNKVSSHLLPHNVPIADTAIRRVRLERLSCNSTCRSFATIRGRYRDA